MHALTHAHTHTHTHTPTHTHSDNVRAIWVEPIKLQILLIMLHCESNSPIMLKIICKLLIIIIIVIILNIASKRSILERAKRVLKQ